MARADNTLEPGQEGSAPLSRITVTLYGSEFARDELKVAVSFAEQLRGGWGTEAGEMLNLKNRGRILEAHDGGLKVAGGNGTAPGTS